MNDARADLDKLLQAGLALMASDLLVKAFSPPLLRIDGELFVTDLPSLTPESSEALARAAVTEVDWKRFQESLELDAAYSLADAVRFRVNLYMQQKTVAAAFRLIPSVIRSMEALGLPPVCNSFVERPRGLLLITGPTGAGKTTTQASMVDFINKHFPCHIITIEDPVEFVHKDEKALISQRQIGRDSDSFPTALRCVLREDPDVILIGEMRDPESTNLALQAAETGHLVISTLHTMDAAETVNRIVDIFPTRRQQQIRIQLSMNLIGVVSQVLARRADGSGRVAAFEVLVAVPAVRAAIRDNKIYQIPTLIQTGAKVGMLTLDRSLAELVRTGQITYEEGLCRANHPDEYTVMALSSSRESTTSENNLQQVSGKNVTVLPISP